MGTECYDVTMEGAVCMCEAMRLCRAFLQIDVQVQPRMSMALEVRRVRVVNLNVQATFEALSKVPL